MGRVGAGCWSSPIHTPRLDPNMNANAESPPTPNENTPPPDDDLVARLNELEAAVESQSERIDGLEAKNQALRERIDELETTQEVVSDSLWNLEDFIIGDRDLSSDHIQPDYDLLTRLADLRRSTADTDDVDSLEGEIDNAIDRYSQQAAMLQKRLAAIEDETGIDSMALVTDDDHISRLIEHGPEDVFPRVHKKHRRARMMLANASTWGDTASDKLGRRVIFKTSTVKPLLEAKENRSFASSEIDRVFQAVAELGKMTTRRVKKDKSEDGEHRLSVWGLDDAR